MERHEALELFSGLFMSIISCLEAISQSTSLESNRDSRSDAQSFLLALSQFPLWDCISHKQFWDTLRV